MSVAWGKPRIKFAKLNENGSGVVSGAWAELPTPVEHSTKLTVTKGEKKEAKIEGGANEAVRYGANSYTFELEIRGLRGRPKPIPDIDGIVQGEYALLVQPEDKTVEGLQINRCAVSVEDSFDTENGIIWKYTFEVLKPKTGTQVQYKIINLDTPTIA